MVIAVILVIMVIAYVVLAWIQAFRPIPYIVPVRAVTGVAGEPVRVRRSQRRVEVGQVTGPQGERGGSGRVRVGHDPILLHRVRDPDGPRTG